MLTVVQSFLKKNHQIHNLNQIHRLGVVVLEELLLIFYS